MLLKAIFVAVIAAVATITKASAGQLGEPSDSGLHNNDRVTHHDRDHHERQLVMGDGFKGCVELPGGKVKDGSRLVLGNCSNRDWGFDWSDPDARVAMLVSRKDPTMCVQADTPLKERNYLRLRKCRETRRSQLFDWTSGVAPIDDKSLCLSYHGQTPDIGDFIKLKKCSKATGGWSWD
jgi:hypothetical protein